MHRFAPELPLLQPMTEQEQFDQSIAEERLVARLAVFFGLPAALPVAAGLYGTLSHQMSRRTAEAGIRMALGARQGQVLWLVLGRSLAASAAGIPMAQGGRLMVALAASAIPARRAASTNPMAALRCQ